MGRQSSLGWDGLVGVSKGCRAMGFSVGRVQGAGLLEG